MCNRLRHARYRATGATGRGITGARRVRCHSRTRGRGRTHGRHTRGRTSHSRRLTTKALTALTALTALKALKALKALTALGAELTNGRSGLAGAEPASPRPTPGLGQAAGAAFESGLPGRPRVHAGLPASLTGPARIEPVPDQSGSDRAQSGSRRGACRTPVDAAEQFADGVIGELVTHDPAVFGRGHQARRPQQP